MRQMWHLIFIWKQKSVKMQQEKKLNLMIK